ncbi:MAG: hypothetical protein EOO01_23375, partial [Chitinophagaceae bacterium]
MLNRAKSGLLLPVLLFLISCGKEKSIDTLGSTGSPNTSTGKITMTINGKAWVADKFAVASIAQGMISIYGISNDRKNFVITLTGTTIGEYQLDQATPNVGAWSDSTETSSFGYTTNQGNSPADAGGKVFVTKIDTAKKTISGTFQFNMFRELDNGKKIVTNGVFQDIYYGPVTGVPGGNTGGSGSIPGGGGTVVNAGSIIVTVDGVVYAPKQTAVAVNFGNIAINGNDANDVRAIGLQFPANIAVGSYDLDLFSGRLGVYVVDLNNAYTSESGKLVITEHNTATKKLKGTFNFKGTNLLGGLICGLGIRARAKKCLGKGIGPAAVTNTGIPARGFGVVAVFDVILVVILHEGFFDDIRPVALAVFTNARFCVDDVVDGNIDRGTVRGHHLDVVSRRSGAHLLYSVL